MHDGLKRGQSHRRFEVEAILLGKGKGKSCMIADELPLIASYK